MSKLIDTYLKPVGPLRYAWRESNRVFDIAFLASLVLWTAQELWLRDQFLPEEQHRTINHLLDMLSVVWGSFFTGYIFYWLINHVPESRKKYAAQLDIERNIVSIFDAHRDFYIGVLMWVERKHSEDEKCSIYRIPMEMDLDFIPALIAKREPLTFNQPLTENGNYCDPFGGMLESKWYHIIHVTEDLLDIKVSLEHDLVDALENVQIEGGLWADQHADETTRMFNLGRWSESLMWLYEYVETKVRKGDYLDPRMKLLLQNNSFGHLWDESEQQKKDAHSFRGTRILVATPPEQQEPPPQAASAPST